LHDLAIELLWTHPGCPFFLPAVAGLDSFLFIIARNYIVNELGKKTQLPVNVEYVEMLPRSINLSHLLKISKFKGKVHFQMRGGKITVNS